MLDSIGMPEEYQPILWGVIVVHVLAFGFWASICLKDVSNCLKLSIQKMLISKQLQFTFENSKVSC